VSEMTGPSDEILLDALHRAITQLPGAPSTAVEAARATFTWRTIDAELAVLTSDSLEDEELVGTREEPTTGPMGARMLTFEAPSFSVEIMVTRDLRILGFIAPASPGRVSIDHSGGIARLETDELGRFETGPLQSGPVRLHVVVDDTHVDTTWVLI